LKLFGLLTTSRINANSAKISYIASVSDSVGFQTDIPALNSAVGGAPAIEQGWGFSVVVAETLKDQTARLDLLLDRFRLHANGTGLTEIAIGDLQ
jgi:Methyl-accepting chemotaxis protein (MCP) signalling domain